MLDQAPPPAIEGPAVPADLQAMIDRAIADGDAKVIDKLFDYAKAARPDLAAALTAQRKAHLQQVAAREVEAAETARRKLTDAGPFDNWSGQVEFGASWSTGPAESLGAVGALDLKREGVNWTHALALRGEVQDTDGVRAVERVVASWQPRYALSPKSYMFGLTQYEHDPALGYDARYTAALGAGWSLKSGKTLKLALEGGPAVRRTVQDGIANTRLAGRGTVDLGLALGPRLDFAQRASVFYEDGTSSGLFTSTLDSKLSEKLKLRLTYEYRVEQDGISGTSSSGSISRASLVYKL
ncbi:MAG: DUF481 domain-containing protein [Proteobacteria bacterium]|nr:DUF481 domain-containing protein [Pseudomonadota bacterium]